ncbi:MAG: mechanosensitive ion channel family protein [Gemmatimonadaceae bacterium]
MNLFSSLADPASIKLMLLATIPRIAAALAVFLLFWLVLKVAQPALRAMLARAHFAPALIKLLVDGLLRATILMLGLAMAASQVGINISAFLAGLGVVGIAVGFAAQETVANMIAGFLIFWDRPFRIGDYISTQDQYGEVQDITMRTTRIRTRENTFVVIPNKQIIGDTLVNHSIYGETRANIPVGIAYKENIAQAREVLLNAARLLEGVMKLPAPDVVAVGLGESSVDLNVRVWVESASDEKPVFFRVVEASKLALDEAGIEIPFPHLRLFLEDVREKVWKDVQAHSNFGGRSS